MNAFCSRGHELTEENTFPRSDRDKRVCRACRNENQRKIRAARASLPFNQPVTESSHEEMLGEDLHQFLAQRAHELTLKMVEHECEHGKLPGDRGLACDCWEVTV